MCTAYACVHTAFMRTCMHTACSRQQRDAAGGRLRRVEPGSSPMVRAGTLIYVPLPIATRAALLLCAIMPQQESLLLLLLLLLLGRSAPR